MTLQTIASQLLQSTLANAEKSPSRTTTIQSSDEIEVARVKEIQTALVVGKSQHLTNETPVFIVADVNGTVISSARLSQKDGLRLELHNGGELRLNGAVKADDLVTFMYAIATPAPTESFRVTLFRDNDLSFSSSLDKFDLSVQHNVPRVTQTEWPVILRSRSARATNYCKTYAFCKNEPTDDKCCNAFTGKCHHNC